MTIKLWSMIYAIRVEVCAFDSYGVNSVIFSPYDATKLAAGGEDQKVTIYDLKGPIPICEFCHTDTVNAITFSKDGKNIASGSEDGQVILCDVEGQTILHEFNHAGCVIYSVAMYNDKLAVGGDDNDGDIV